MTDAGEVVVYYQRLGGLGGASGTELGTLAGLAPDDWNDSGSDLSDVVADTESPILAMATSGNAAYVSSVVGAFRATEEEVFTRDDIDVDALLGRYFNERQDSPFLRLPIPAPAGHFEFTRSV